MTIISYFKTSCDENKLPVFLISVKLDGFAIQFFLQWSRKQQLIYVSILGIMIRLNR